MNHTDMKKVLFAFLILLVLLTPAFGQKPSNIRLSGGIRDQRRSFLSVPEDGSQTDVWFTDDGSGRQQWILKHGPSGRWDNILIAGGVSNGKKYLSVTQDGSKSDLFYQDDGSGRQRWVIEKIDGGLVHIRIFGGVDGDGKLLGIFSDGRRMGLFSADDGSGRQRWKISEAENQAVIVEKRKDQVAAAAKKDADEAVPIAVDAFTFGGNNARYRVTNGNHVALTAYAIQGARPSGQQWSHVDDFRIAQSEPLTSGQSHLGEEIWNTFQYPRGLHVTAAIFADGSTKGDSHIIETLMKKRLEQLFTYSVMSHAICGMARKGEKSDAILRELATRKPEYLHSYSGQRYVNSGGEDAYDAVIRGLSDKAKSASSSAVHMTLSNIHDMSVSLLLDRVRDANGKYFLQDIAPPDSCH